MNEAKSKKEGKLMNGRTRKKKKVEWLIESSRRKWKKKLTNGSAEKQKEDIMNESEKRRKNGEWMKMQEKKGEEINERKWKKE